MYPLRTRLHKSMVARKSVGVKIKRTEFKNESCELVVMIQYVDVRVNYYEKKKIKTTDQSSMDRYIPIG